MLLKPSLGIHRRAFKINLVGPLGALNWFYRGETLCQRVYGSVKNLLLIGHKFKYVTKSKGLWWWMWITVSGSVFKIAAVVHLSVAHSCRLLYEDVLSSQLLFSTKREKRRKGTWTNFPWHLESSFIDFAVGFVSVNLWPLLLCSINTSSSRRRCNTFLWRAGQFHALLLWLILMLV